ncbi:MAG: signal recognition particle-docking protein FtsY [Candidatus Nitrosopolaris sp.]
MFEKLRKAIHRRKQNRNNDIDTISLMESEVAQEVIDYFEKRIRLEKTLTPQKIIKEIFDKAEKIDLIDRIKRHYSQGPFVILFLGTNGAGKTTTIAKIANLLRKNGISVVLAATDTHRAGAIEQLRQHGKRLRIKVITQKYGADPSAVATDAIQYAAKHAIQVTLIDTAGRMNNSKPLMNELNSLQQVVKVTKPDMKIFIGDALTGNDAIDQAKIFHNYTEFDGVIMTKMDVDTKGGSAISISYITSKPILYVGTGQRYDDLQSFDSEKFIEKLEEEHIGA